MKAHRAVNVLVRGNYSILAVTAAFLSCFATSPTSLCSTPSQLASKGVCSRHYRFPLVLRIRLIGDGDDQMPERQNLRLVFRVEYPVPGPRCDRFTPIHR